MLYADVDVTQVVLVNL